MPRVLVDYASPQTAVSLWIALSTATASVDSERQRRQEWRSDSGRRLTVRPGQAPHHCWRTRARVRQPWSHPTVADGRVGEPTLSCKTHGHCEPQRRLGSQSPHCSVKIGRASRPERAAPANRCRRDRQRQVHELRFTGIRAVANRQPLCGQSTGVDATSDTEQRPALPRPRVKLMDGGKCADPCCSTVYSPDAARERYLGLSRHVLVLDWMAIWCVDGSGWRCPSAQPK